MEDFNYRRKQVEFWQITGQVVASDKYNETNIRGSGGGGYIGEYGGTIKPISISSSTVINHEFWIQTEYGVEQDIKLYNIDIPLRIGQKITLISAKRKGFDFGFYSILVNHSAGKHWFINSAEDLNKKLQLEQFTGISLLIGGLIFWGLSSLTNENLEYLRDSVVYFQKVTGILDEISWQYIGQTLVWGVPLTFVVYRWVLKLNRVSRLRNRLENHLEKLAQLAYTN